MISLLAALLASAHAAQLQTSGYFDDCLIGVTKNGEWECSSSPLEISVDTSGHVLANGQRFKVGQAKTNPNTAMVYGEDETSNLFSIKEGLLFYNGSSAFSGCIFNKMIFPEGGGCRYPTDPGVVKVLGEVSDGSGSASNDSSSSQPSTLASSSGSFPVIGVDSDATDTIPSVPTTETLVMSTAIGPVIIESIASSEGGSQPVEVGTSHACAGGTCVAPANEASRPLLNSWVQAAAFVLNYL